MERTIPAQRGPNGVIERVCGASGCTTRHYAKGYCKKHYAQTLRHGRLTPEAERGEPRVCLVPNCGRTDTLRHYCRKHAAQIARNGKIGAREYVRGRVGCKIRGCKAEHRAKGYCTNHYAQQRAKQRAS